MSPEPKLYLRPSTIIASAVALIALLSLACGCGGPVLFQADPEQSWEDLCPPESEESRALTVDSECNYRTVTLTSEAACAADDPFACALAAALYEDEDSPIRDHDRAVELAEWSCEQGDANACYSLAYVLFQGDIYEKGRAYNLMRQTCMDGMGLSCHRIGSWYRREPESLREKRLAAGFFKRSCDNGFAPGCHEFAQVYEEGFGVRRNRERADQLYQKACELGHRKSCLAVDREPPHNEEDMFSEYLGITNEEYVSLHMTACTNGFEHACTRAGLFIEWGVMRGRYISRNIDRAAEFYRKGCELGAPMSCWSLARVERHGAVALGRGSLKADTSEATALAKKACEMGLERGCERFRDYRFRLFDEPQAEEFAARCEQGDAQACYLSARAFAYDNNFPRDNERALALIEKGCELAYAPACEYAGRYHAEGVGTQVDEAAASRLFEEACEAGSGYGCHALAVAHINGEGVDKDIARGLELAEIACRRDEGQSCVLAGLRYEKGDGVEEDDERARAYYAKGCAYRRTWACTRLGIMQRHGRGGDEDLESARDNFALACANDEGAACYELAEMYEAGEGSDDLADDASSEDQADPIQAADHFEKACLAEHSAGCAELARLHEEGKGVRKDMAKAKMLRQRACQEGHEDSCADEPSEPTRDGDEDESDPPSQEAQKS